MNCYEGTSRGNPVLSDVAFRVALNWAHRPAADRRPRLGRQGKPGTTIMTPDSWVDPDYHWQPPADVALRVRPGQGEAAPRRGRLQGHRRRRHPRGQGRQAHQAAAVGARRVAGEPEDRQPAHRLAPRPGPQDRVPGHGRRHLLRQHLGVPGRHVQPRLRPVPVGLGRLRRPGRHAGELHHGADRELERALLVERGVRPRSSSRPTRRSTRRSARTSSGGRSRSSTSSRRRSSLDYPDKLEAINTAKWDGWTRMYGGTGAAFYTSYVRDSYLNLTPKAAAARTDGGGSDGCLDRRRRGRGRGDPRRRRRAAALPAPAGGGRGGVTGQAPCRRRPAAPACRRQYTSTLSLPARLAA